MTTGRSRLGAQLRARRGARSRPTLRARGRIHRGREGAAEKLAQNDAFIGDKESGRFIDTAKVHRIEHRGKYFQRRRAVQSAAQRTGSSRADLRPAARPTDANSRPATPKPCSPHHQSFDEAAAYARELKSVSGSMGPRQRCDSRVAGAHDDHRRNRSRGFAPSR